MRYSRAWLAQAVAEGSLAAQSGVIKPGVVLLEVQMGRMAPYPVSSFPDFESLLTLIGSATRPLKMSFRVPASVVAADQESLIYRAPEVAVDSLGLDREDFDEDSDEDFGSAAELHNASLSSTSGPVTRHAPTPPLPWPQRTSHARTCRGGMCSSDSELAGACRLLGLDWGESSLSPRMSVEEPRPSSILGAEWGEGALPAQPSAT